MPKDQRHPHHYLLVPRTLLSLAFSQEMRELPESILCLQDCALSLLLGFWSGHCCPLLTHPPWLPIACSIKPNLLCLLFQALHTCPSSLFSFHSPSCPLHQPHGCHAIPSASHGSSQSTFLQSQALAYMQTDEARRRREGSGAPAQPRRSKNSGGFNVSPERTGSC